MKNDNVKKINTVGRVSRIVLVVFRVFAIIGIVSCLVGAVIAGIASAKVPKDVFRADISVNGTITINGAKIPSFISKEITGLEESDIDLGMGNYNIKMLIDEIEDDDVSGYTIDGKVDMSEGTLLMLGIMGMCIAGAIGCGVMLMVIIFGGKLAKALENCNSPFEEQVLKAMKGFAFSLIPVGIIVFFADGALGLTTAFVVAAIILMTFVFKYGAELQKESDDTV